MSDVVDRDAEAAWRTLIYADRNSLNLEQFTAYVNREFGRNYEARELKTKFETLRKQDEPTPGGKEVTENSLIERLIRRKMPSDSLRLRRPTLRLDRRSPPHLTSNSTTLGALLE